MIFFYKIQEFNATNIILDVGEHEMTTLQEIQFILQMVPNHHSQIIVTTIQHLHDEFIFGGDIFAFSDERQNRFMEILTLQQRLMQFMGQFAFRVQLNQPIMWVEVLISYLGLAAFRFITFERINQVIQILNDSTFLGIFTLTPQVHIIILLVIEGTLQNVSIIQGEQFGSGDSTLHTQSECDTLSHYDDLFEILDEFTTLTIDPIQDGETILQHLTVLEEGHLCEHHLDGESGW